MNRAKGFSLIELAVVMTIAGLLLSAFLHFYAIQQEKAHFDVTRERLKDLRMALTMYVVTHERLPCPASPAGAAPDDADAACAPQARPQPEVTAFKTDPHSMDETDEVWTGVVPVRDLRLEDEAGVDGWGRRFTYAVTRKLTLPQGMRGNPVPPGLIAVTDAEGKNLLDVAGTARYVVVSHGRTGAGAWMPQGGRRACDKKSRDGENCNDDASFVIAPFTTKPGEGFYDDVAIHDDTRAGGTLLDRLVVCNAKREYYAPAEKSADKDGCVPVVGMWQGACLYSVEKQEKGEQPSGNAPAVAVMPPATVKGSACACEDGYQSVKVGGWYAGPDIHGSWTVMNVAVGTMTVGRSDPSVETRLYTCVKK